MSLNKARQRVWFSKRAEKLVGGTKIPVFGKPVLKYYPVSATSGNPGDSSAGIVPEYDRYVTRDKAKDRHNTFQFEEGDVLWVDREPRLDKDGNVEVDEKHEAIIPPDYVLKKILDTRKGTVARLGISKIGGT